MRKFNLFFIISFFCSIFVWGQSPGGVATDLGLWVKADVGFTPSSWSDQSGNNYHLTQGTAGLQPVLTTGSNKFNFNPSVNFDNKVMGNNQVANRGVNNSLSLYSVASLETDSNANTLIGIGSAGDNPHLGAYPGATFMMYTSLYGNSANPSMDMSRSYLMSGHWQHATAGAARIELNGFPARTGGTQNSAAGNFLVGNDYINTANQPWKGLIPEVIAYVSPKSGNENQRINSYLGIKYGLTLRTGGVTTGTFDYLSSSSVVVWNGTGNATYHNNVFGIARDNASALHQKQSKSVNPNQKLIIGVGSTLFDTNVANTNSLSEGQFLMVGDNGLKQSLSVSMSYPLAPGGRINNRFASIWKVQNTGNTGTVTVAWPKGITNLHLVRSTDSLFDTSDEFIPMSSEVTVNGTVYNTATLTLNDGDYFTFAGFVQAPGGVVSNLLMWHKANDGTTVAGAKNIWKDVSINGKDVTQNNNAAYQPSLVTNAIYSSDNKDYFFNYNPFYYFDGTNDFFFRDFGTTGDYFPSSGAGSVYGVMFNVGDTGSWHTSYGWGDDTPNLVGLADKYYFARNNGVALEQDVALTTLPAHIGGMTWKATGNNGLYLNVNGRVYSTTSTHIGTINDRYFAIGSEGYNLTGAGNELFKGGMSEVFAYDMDHQNSVGDEKQRINSYLAIKYGITLSNDAGTSVSNYLSSISTIVWNSTTNNGYNNNIAGLAYDFNSALDQKQSISSNSGQKLVIGTTGLANNNMSNTLSLAENQFFVWGDNGLRQNLSVSINGITGVNYRFASIWKAQNTNNVNTVRVAWPKGFTNLKLIQSIDETFDSGDTVTDMSVNTITINGKDYNYADVIIPNGQYFTFAAFSHAPGGVVNSLSYWYRADIDAANTGNNTDVTSWKDFYSGTISSKMGTNAFPKYIKGAANYFNYNPGIQFAAALQSLGNDKIASTVTSTDYDIFTFTKEGWIPANGSNNRIFSALSNINYQTGSINYWDGIGINKRFSGNTADEVESVSVNITDRYLAVPGNINFAATIPSIMYHRYGNTTVSRGLNGEANGANGTFSPRGILTGGHIFGSTIYNGNGSDNDNALGHIGETIIYGAGNLTETERRRVDSYLAIKYGLTLGRVATNHYLSSTESVVWNGTTNSTFNNNIFGIGRDDISALHQKVSNSVNSGTILTMATNNDFISENLSASRVAISDDLEFMLTGDNNITAVPMQAASFGNGNAKIIQRKWLVQRTGTLNDVYYQADLSAYESQFYTPASAYMVIADDAAFTTNRILVPGTKVAGKWVFSHNFDNENVKRYITFATLENGFCYKPGTPETVGTPALISKVGISSLIRTDAQNAENWPATRKGAWLALESKTKGFVVNRLAFNASGNPVGISPANFVEGMLVYDITNKCLKMYTSTDGGTNFGWYCITTQTCPD